MECEKKLPYVNAGITLKLYDAVRRLNLKILPRSLNNLSWQTKFKFFLDIVSLATYLYFMILSFKIPDFLPADIIDFPDNLLCNT